MTRQAIMAFNLSLAEETSIHVGAGVYWTTLACSLCLVLQQSYLVSIQLGALGEPAAPRVDEGDGVGAGLTALLMHSVVTRDCAVHGLRQHRLHSTTPHTNLLLEPFRDQNWGARRSLRTGREHLYTRRSFQVQAAPIPSRSPQHPHWIVIWMSSKLPSKDHTTSQFHLPLCWYPRGGGGGGGGRRATATF